MNRALHSSIQASPTRPIATEDLFWRLENQGYRELTAAHLLCAGVTLAPTVDDKQMLAAHVGEELSHFETIASVYEELGGGDLLALLQDRLGSLAPPTSWPEMVVAALLFDLSVYHQLLTYRELSHIVLRRVVDSGLSNEHAHQRAAEAMFVDMVRTGPQDMDLGLAIARWLDFALATLDDAPRMGASPAAPEHTTQQGADPAQTFVADVARILASVGLSLPASVAQRAPSAPAAG